MGFFSWRTSDTEESIMIGGLGKKQTVYMIDKNNNRYKESDYRGYGIFGGKDAYELLAEMNGFSEETDEEKAEQNARKGRTLRSIGIDLAFGEFILDTNTGSMYSPGKGFKYKDWIKRISGFYDEPMAELDGVSINTAINKGRARKIPKKLVIMKYKKFYPLKFSENPNAKYEKLRGAKDDPTQGFGS